MAGLSAVNPHTGLSESLLGTGLGPDLQGAIVDPAAMQLLHMNTVADPNREPTFTFFGNPNFFFETAGSTTPVVGTGFAWNHGDIQPEIARTFIAIAGPGVKNLGVTGPHDFFTDHVDLRPTMMTLLGLTDDYQHDGRTIVELLDPKVLPSSLRAHSDTLLQLGQIYKKINAPFGELSKHTLAVSTYANHQHFRRRRRSTTTSKISSRIGPWSATAWLQKSRPCSKLRSSTAYQLMKRWRTI